jgi:hypothetical protein
MALRCIAGLASAMKTPSKGFINAGPLYLIGSRLTTPKPVETPRPASPRNRGVRWTGLWAGHTNLLLGQRLQALARSLFLALNPKSPQELSGVNPRRPRRLIAEELVLAKQKPAGAKTSQGRIRGGAGLIDSQTAARDQQGPQDPRHAKLGYPTQPKSTPWGERPQATGTKWICRTSSLAPQASTPHEGTRNGADHLPCPTPILRWP